MRNMRRVEISTDVYAKIWSHRQPGEESEDQILARILGVRLTKVRKEDVSMKQQLWRDDVKLALQQLGGSAPLTEIYAAVRNIRIINGRTLPPSTNAIIRREIEYNSSDTESYQHKLDWFKTVDGIGSGVWALR